MWYLCAAEYHSAVRKEEILPFATKYTDLEGIMCSDISQKEREKCYLYVESKKENKKVIGGCGRG